MKKYFLSFLVILSGLLFLLCTNAQAQAKPLVHVVKVDSVISPATYDLIRRHIRIARDHNADALVLQIHTPGGLYDSTQDIIQDILNAPMPVITYVSPSGSHAASAGTYILYASHIAAMAPGTNIGAATPVQMTPQGVQDAQDDSTDKKDKKNKDKNSGLSSMEKKMVNDATAYIKTLAELRDRNLAWAESAVREAETLTASEALKEKVIDVVADDVKKLLDAVHGKTVKMAEGKKQELNTKDAQVVKFEPDWRTDLLEIISHPNVAFLLMTLGSYGLIYEMANPGAFFPGVVGAICLLLALYAMNVMPINYTGFMLIVLGVLLMTGEAFVPSFGALGIGGAVAFAVGAVMLIDSTTPGFGVDPWLIGVMTLTSIGILSLLMTMAVRAMRKHPTTGKEELLQSVGEIVTWSKGNGSVRITGEIWQAYTDTDYILKKGDEVRVLKVDGLRLEVGPNHEEGTEET